MGGQAVTAQTRFMDKKQEAASAHGYPGGAGRGGIAAGICVLRRSVMSSSSRPHGLQLTRLLRPWDFPGKSTGVGCHCFLWEEVV